MTPFLHGFLHELAIVKTAGALKSIGRFAVKNPLVTATAVGTIAATGMAAGRGYKEGLQGGEKPRYLAAGVDPSSGDVQASEAAYNNYNQLFDRKPSPKAAKQSSKYYKENAFRR